MDRIYRSTIDISTAKSEVLNLIGRTLGSLRWSEQVERLEVLVFFHGVSSNEVVNTG